MKSKQNGTELSTYLKGVPAGQYNEIRETIMERCRVSNATLYAWIRGSHRVPHTAKIVINQVTKSEVFKIN